MPKSSPRQSMKQISESVNLLEGHLVTLHDMIDALQTKLYGEDSTEEAEVSVPLDGIESRLSEQVTSTERLMQKLDHIISNL